MPAKERSDRFLEEEEAYRRYTVVDPQGNKLGRVDDLFLSKTGGPEYFGVKIGTFGTSATLIPVEATSIDEHETITVDGTKDELKSAPAFDDDEPITPDYESQVRAYWGLEGFSDYETRGTYAAYEPGEAEEARVTRTEEEPVAGTQAREAGRVRLHKRVVTEPQQITVPRRREEVSVERVPASEASTTDAEIGEHEVEVPVTEEEVVVGKRPVVKEEYRVKKNVVEEEQPVETEVRKEQVDVEDTTGRQAS